jgi:carbon storage regulator
MENSSPYNRRTYGCGAEAMLILTRKVNETIMIGDKIEISIVDIKGDQVKVGIRAPRHVKIYRQEVYKAIQEENIEALQTKPDVLPHLDNLLDNVKKKKGKE